MALSFEPDQIVYDLEESLIRFLATEQGEVIRCGISIAALAELEDNAFSGPDEIVTSYFKHRHLIQDIAERKYRAHRFETGGKVIVRLQDLAL
jgi:hypothetical protein